MTADSYRAELRSLIETVYIDNLGGRATKNTVHMKVHEVLPDHLVDYLIGKGLDAEVSAYFRTKGTDGLPRFPEVNRDGEHAQLELLSVSELGFMHTKYLDRARANTDQAQKVRLRCLTIHGVDLESLAVLA